MVRISTRGRYALRAMVDLALHASEEPVLRHNIARRQEISAHYIAQLFRHLDAAGLVEGVKGPGGGYRLTRDARTISAGDVVRAVEGPLALVNCILSSDQPSCARADFCVTRQLWQGLSAVMTDFLDSITLKDLCNEAQQLLQDEEE